MKVYQIVSEQTDVNEAPVGMLKRAGTAIASKIPGGIGQRARGRQVSNKEANQVKKELNTWMGTAQIPRNQLTVEQFMTFMDQKGYGGQVLKKVLKTVKPGARKNDLITGSEIDQAILQSIGNVVARQGSNVGRGSLAGAKPKGVFKSKRNAGQFKSKRTGTNVPKNIASAVSQMSPEQKRALAQMLQGGNQS